MQLSFESGLIPSAIASSPLSMLSFVITGDIKLRKRDLPSVAVGDIQEMIEKIQKLPFGTETSHPAIRATREMISAAFSSLSVLNASFIDVGSLGHGRLCVDLNEIRKAYSLIMSVEKLHPSVIATLGRATLHLSDQLRGCPFDDGENLSVFFIVLENPLMIRAAEFHVAIERVSLPSFTGDD